MNLKLIAIILLIFWGFAICLTDEGNSEIKRGWHGPFLGGE